MMDAPRNRPPLLDIVTALRPSQWTKNGVVLAAFFFAYWDRTREAVLGPLDLLRVVPAAACFCVVSSAVYLFNDIRDIDADRHHPVKQFRPIASGRLPVSHAAFLAVALLAVGLAGAHVLAAPFALVLCAYVALQTAYSLWLKHVALADALVIAAGFVLRAVAGAEVLPGVTISPWLLLCTFLLALFLALCKRRHEKGLLPDGATSHRPSLNDYDPQLLDQLIAISAGATIVCYSIYTLWPATVEKFGTNGLGFTIPFVIFGVFRYLDLVYRHDQGGRPERILLTDLPLLVDIGLYGLTAVLVFTLPH
jgi:4-hydroxybenzoate polyprenyltransferase